MKRGSSRYAGITLIELLVVMVIIGVLAGVAMPSYLTHIAKTNRGAAKACLSEYAQFMERYYTTNLTYVGAVPSPGCRLESGMNQRYTFTTSNLGAKTYTLTATPIDVQAQRDAKCGSLGVNQDGVRTASGSSGVASCW